jgi:geranylgeranyl diphosphate synthase type I
MSSKKLMEKVKQLLEKRGRKAYEVAKDEILNEEIDYKPLRDALQYFIQELWHNFQHPALLVLTCESVGGKPEKTTSIGVALILLTGAADIHDDIIDQSKTKGSKPTVFGKFGRDIALLAGDALLLKGFTLLSKACGGLPKKQGETIINLVEDAFFEIGIAEAKETSFKGNWDLAPEEYLDIIRMKAAIADVTARIGAIIGGGSSEEIEAFGRYGRTLGILATIRDDFIDIFEPDEIKNRAENECLPLPVLYVFRDQKVKNKIINILRKGELREDDTYEIVQAITETENMQVLKKEVQVLLESSIQSLKIVENREVTNNLEEMIRAMVEDLPVDPKPNQELARL